MRFIKNILQNEKKFIFVDIWTYKIRCCVVLIKKNEIHILWYGERKQEPSDFYFGEIQDTHSISNNLQLAIKKAENEAGIEVKSVIFNTGTFKAFFAKEKLIHERTQKWPVKKSEFKGILQEFLHSLKAHDKPLAKWLYWTKDMKLILWNIRSIFLDSEKRHNILAQDGKIIEIELDQFFMENWKYSQLKKFSTHCGKTLELVIPYENAIKDLVNIWGNTKDHIIINIGNARTQIVIVKEHDVFMSTYFNIWIWELLSTISKKYKLTQIRAIKTVESDALYTEEKNDFYQIWEEALKITLEDLISHSICPHDIYLFWGGVNSFIRDKIRDFSATGRDIMLRKNFCIQDISKDKIQDIEGKFQLDVRSNFSLLAMMIATQNYFKWSHNEMVHMLQKLIKQQ